MKRSPKAAIVLLLSLALVLPLSVAVAQDATPEPSLVSGDGSGPVAVTGILNASNFAASQIFQKPTVALIDISQNVPRLTGHLVPESGQILGYATTPFFQQGVEGTYRVELPIAPQGETLSVGDGSGVQVYKIVIGNNVVGDAYLTQLEQSGLDSTLYDSLTGDFLQGHVLVFAADDQAVFPIGAGPDGLWFTADDETQTLEQGYTVVHLAPDGTATFDRSAMPSMDIVEDPAVASLDLSGMGLLDSFNALIDRLSERYSFTEVRGIDWEAWRQEFLPQIQEADANGDLAEYAFVLQTIADRVRDAHVSLIPTTPESTAALQTVFGVMAQNLLGNVGAAPVFIPDPDNREDPTAGKVLIFSVGDTGPAHDAGWVPGTEIISIDGQTLDERRALIPLGASGGSVGTEAGFINRTSGLLLNLAPGEEMTVEYKLPGDDTVQSATLIGGNYPIGAPPRVNAPDGPDNPDWYNTFENYTVIHWNEFTDNFPAKVANMEEALKREAASPSSGVILDLRGNGGGWSGGYLTLASYFFTADDPLLTDVFDKWTYDEETGTLVKEFNPTLSLSSPNPAVAYTGPLTILVDEHCGSSCEFFSQMLQKVGRATVVGQYATAGAGGNIDQVTLPGGFRFQYTVGQSYFFGTDELNLEGKGVTPDIWLPVTLETEMAKFSDPNYVLEMAIEAISPPDTGTSVAPDSGTPIATDPAATPAA